MNPILEEIVRNHRSAVEGMFTDCGDQLGELAKTCANALNNKETSVLRQWRQRLRFDAYCR